MAESTLLSLRHAELIEQAPATSGGGPLLQMHICYKSLFCGIFTLRQDALPVEILAAQRLASIDLADARKDNQPGGNWS